MLALQYVENKGVSSEDRKAAVKLKMQRRTQRACVSVYNDKHITHTKTAIFFFFSTCAL